ncbi:conserved hypothetical protein [Trichinella spiralis]|uniref:hypothetical protein n=1 Tax=Trichinella spiralis TaxID=6334 RepID=UPI0001EFBE1F|nr:conserved hypothetical protein [Trichinella spiralis]
MLCMLLCIYGDWNLADCKLATPSAAHLLLYSYVQRKKYSFLDVQDNTTQYLERMWLSLFFAELSSLVYHQGGNATFDYCSVHVSTVISHESQQFRFLVFFIVTIRMNFMHFVIAMGCVSAVEPFLQT